MEQRGGYSSSSGAEFGKILDAINIGESQNVPEGSKGIFQDFSDKPSGMKKRIRFTSQ